jgi:hypothetical protein
MFGKARQDGADQILALAQRIAAELARDNGKRFGSLVGAEAMAK